MVQADRGHLAAGDDLDTDSRRGRVIPQWVQPGDTLYTGYSP